jgi:hypothetical protein
MALGTALTLVPAGEVEADFQIRVVKSPTPVNSQGEVVNLPNSASFIDEWDTVYVEIYGKADPGYGLQNAVVDIHFNANQFTFHSVIAKQQDSNLKYSLISTNSSVPGKVTVSLSNPLGNTGDDNFALLGRVRLSSIMQLANDTSNGYIQPTTSLPISIGNVSPTLQILGGDESTIGAGNSAGSYSFDVWPVMYDADDDGKIGLSDFTQFIAVYGQPVNSPQTYRFAYDKSGTIGLGDFVLLIQNYGQQRGQLASRTYHSNFPDGFLAGEPMMEGEPMMGGDSLLEGEPVYMVTMEASPTYDSVAEITPTSNFIGGFSTLASSPSFEPAVVQYVGDNLITHSVNLDLSSDSGDSDSAIESYWSMADDPAVIDLDSDADAVIQNVAVVPKADTMNQETDELFEDLEVCLALDW